MMKKMRKEDTSKEISLQELVEDGALCPFSSSKNELYCSICTDGVTRNYLLSSPSFRVAFKSAYKKYTGEIITDIQFKYKLDLKISCPICSLIAYASMRTPFSMI